MDVDVDLVTARAWNEGGEVVTLDARDERWVTGAATIGRHPYRFLYDPRPLWRQLRSGGHEVLDIHEEPASLAAAEVLLLSWLARRTRPAVCLYSAQNIEKRYPVPFRWFEQLALRRVAAVHTCNDEAGRILRRKGFRGTVLNLGLGVEIDRFAPADAESRTGTPPFEVLRVGYVGRLERHKGVEVLVDAVAALDGAELSVVGDGPEREALTRQVARLGLSERVSFRGFADQADLPAVYRSFDVLVVPSLETSSWIEQFGRVAIEAMSSGVAVVASDSGSLPEVVGGAGVLVPPGDVVALAAALQALTDDPERRRELASAGRNRSRAYSWTAIAERQAELYVQVRP